MSGMFGSFFAENPFRKLTPDDIAARVSKKNFVVVGGTSGIGKSIALALCKHGAASVTIIGRRQPDASLQGCKFVEKDLSLIKNARDLANELDHCKKTDVLVVCAGLPLVSPIGAERKETVEGIELDMATSYLWRYAFMKKIVETGKFGTKRNDLTVKPRCFFMDYVGKENTCEIDDFNSRKEYGAIQAHSRTIIGNENLVDITVKKSPFLNVFGVNPGVIQTEHRKSYLGKEGVGAYGSWALEGVTGLVCQSADQYAENVLLHLLVSPVYESGETGLALTLIGKSGVLFDSNGAELKPSSFLTMRNRNKVAQESDDLVEKAMNAYVNKGSLGKMLDKGLKAVDKIQDGITKDMAEMSGSAKSSAGSARIMGAMAGL